MLTALTLACCASWVWLLQWHGNFWHILLPRAPRSAPESWPEVAIIVPARDETEVLPRSLPGLLAQDYPGAWRIILVDDHSGDGTAAAATAIAAAAGMSGRLTVTQPPALPAGWSGKVHAMDWGVRQAGDAAAYYLFTDADILHAPHSLRLLMARSLADRVDLHSLMVKLRCRSFWEKLLVPAFVYFFQMLYPFTWSNAPGSRVAAAAGGTMLVRRAALEEAGGLAAIRGAIIDDCALARAIKFRASREPPRTLLTLTTAEARSLRRYETLDSLWRMISRSAFTQLRYSWLLLALTVLGLFVVFIMPLLLLFAGGPWMIGGLAAIVLMLYSYMPMVQFYGLNFMYSATLPLAAALYLLATLDSARLYAMGRGGAWKGRVQAKAG